MVQSKNIIQERGNIIYLGISLLVALSTYSGVLRLPSWVFMTSLIIIFFILYSNIERMVMSEKIIALFIGICVFSLIYNNPPTYFRAWFRLITFVFILFLFSPLVGSRMLMRKRINLFISLLKIIILFSLLSFVAYFLGINFFVYDGELLDMSEIGHFSGLFNHSMMLGPLAAIASLYSLSMFFCIDERNKKIIWLLCSFCCASASLLASSRGAALGLAMGFLAIIYQKSKLQKKKFSKYILYIIITLAIVGPLTTSIWGNVIAKNEANLEQGGSVMYSREGKMAARIYEIKNNFLTGVGFCVVDESVDYVNKQTGTIEPNSSWLSSFSMMGVLGFLLFFLIYVKAVGRSFRKIQNDFLSLLLCGIIIFWGMHMIIEGYAFAAGNVLCSLYWLTIGTIYAASSCEQYWKNGVN